MKNSYDVIVVGGGPAGLAAAIAAHDGGAHVLILEREARLGGILNQCIHNGFGLTRFKESLSGPEYAARFIEGVRERGIEAMTETTVLSVTPEKTVTAVSPLCGLVTLQAGAVVLAMGCRERSRGALNIAGTRPAGIYSAGTAQKYVNLKGYLPGKDVVILGSGDIGLIMARRMTLEGTKVHAVCEIMPYSSGLKRNIAQCLDDFGIPLYLNHTITRIDGEKRVTGVEISEVDAQKRPIAGSGMYIPCDTVLFSVGLIPENELTKAAGIPLSPRTKGAVVDQTRETCLRGIFACGNVLHVHDLVDFVSEEAEIAGRYAAEYALKGEREKALLPVVCGENVSYVLPQFIDRNREENVKIFFRVKSPVKACIIRVRAGERVLFERKKKVASPGEMESVPLGGRALSEAEGEITVSLEELK